MLFDELTHGLETIYHVAREVGGTLLFSILSESVWSQFIKSVRDGKIL